jgi:hypothetical protein
MSKKFEEWYITNERRKHKRSIAYRAITALFVIGILAFILLECFFFDVFSSDPTKSDSTTWITFKKFTYTTVSAPANTKQTIRFTILDQKSEIVPNKQMFWSFSINGMNTGLNEYVSIDEGVLSYTLPTEYYRVDIKCFYGLYNKMLSCSYYFFLNVH